MNFLRFASRDPIAERVRLILTGFLQLFEGQSSFSVDTVQLISILLLLSVIGNIYLLRRKNVTSSIIDVPDSPDMHAAKATDTTAIVNGCRSGGPSMTSKPPLTTKTLSLPPSMDHTTIAKVGTEKHTNTARNLDECGLLLRSGQAALLTDDELLALVDAGRLPTYGLEKAVGVGARAVALRRRLVGRALGRGDTFHLQSKIPLEHLDYSKVHGVCCENVVGKNKLYEYIYIYI